MIAYAKKLLTTAALCACGTSNNQPSDQTTIPIDGPLSARVDRARLNFDPRFCLQQKDVAHRYFAEEMETLASLFLRQATKEFHLSVISPEDADAFSQCQRETNELDLILGRTESAPPPSATRSVSQTQ